MQMKVSEGEKYKYEKSYCIEKNLYTQKVNS